MKVIYLNLIRRQRTGDSMSNEREIAKIVIGLAEYYDKVPTAAQIEMYVQDLSSLTPQELIEAVKRYRNDPKNDRFPLPAKLKAMVKPPELDEDLAKEAAARIVGAVAKIGPYETERAKAYIGELGWEVVVRQGGWESVCIALDYHNQGTLQAQWRELALSLIRRTRIGLVEKPPMLPKAERAELVNIGDLIASKVQKKGS